MSRISYSTGDCNVVTGWDRPLQTFFLTVYGPSSGSECEDVLFTELALSEQLTEPQDVLNCLTTMHLASPLDLAARLAHHQHEQLGNVVERYAEPISGQPPRPRLVREPRSGYDRGVRLSELHGVNPSVMLCAFCGESTGLALFGKLPGDAAAPREAVLDYEPCTNCAANFKLGTALIVVDQEPCSPGQRPIQEAGGVALYPTGAYLVISVDATRRLFAGELLDAVLKQGRAFIDRELGARLQAEYDELTPRVVREGTPAEYELRAEVRAWRRMACHWLALEAPEDRDRQAALYPSASRAARVREASPELSGVWECGACGELASFVGIDDRGYGGPDDCDCADAGEPDECGCSTRLVQPVTIERDAAGTADVIYSAHTGGGCGAEAGSYTRVRCGRCDALVWQDATLTDDELLVIDAEDD